MHSAMNLRLTAEAGTSTFKQSLMGLPIFMVSISASSAAFLLMRSANFIIIPMRFLGAIFNQVLAL